MLKTRGAGPRTLGSLATPTVAKAKHFVAPSIPFLTCSAFGSVELVTPFMQLGLQKETCFVPPQADYYQVTGQDSTLMTCHTGYVRQT